MLTPSIARVPSRSGALRLADVGVLVAVGLVVLLVSLPRLREFALRENETDAASLVARLGRLCASSVRAAERGDVRDLIASDLTLERQLDDAEFLEDGALLRRHGYLFEILDRDSAGSAGARVRAWPWQCRKTGTAAFAWTDAQVLVGHSNSDGAFSGLAARPVVTDQAAGWRPVGSL